MRVTNSDLSATSTSRSARNTGMPALFASWSTCPQPVTTTGAMMMASTFWAMNARTAFSCSSSLPWASANLRSIPSFFASSCMSLEKAGLQSPSSPTCEKPMVTAKADDPATMRPKPTAAPPSHLIKCINSSLWRFNLNHPIRYRDMSGQPLMGPDTTDVPISNTIRTIVKRRGAPFRRDRARAQRLRKPAISATSPPRVRLPVGLLLPKSIGHDDVIHVSPA